MDNLDERASLFLADPIPFDGQNVYPLKIKDIKGLGFSNFYKVLQLLISDENDLDECPKDRIIYPFDIFFSTIVYCQDVVFQESILSFLKLIFDKSEVYVGEDFISVGEDITLHFQNYDELVEIIKKQYCIKKIPQKAKTAKQKEIDQLRSEKRKKYARWFDEDTEDIVDLLSSICAVHPSINNENIENKTIYYLIDQFKRVGKRDDYFIGIKQLLAGASKEDINLTHWTKKIVN